MAPSSASPSEASRLALTAPVLPGPVLLAATAEDAVCAEPLAPLAAFSLSARACLVAASTAFSAALEPGPSGKGSSLGGVGAAAVVAVPGAPL
eukprot:12876888-Alexandrium_andersonii.AAC.1